MNDEARWLAMTTESKRLHDKPIPPKNYKSVLEREAASWFACTSYADAGLPAEVNVRSNADMKQELKDALALIDFGPARAAEKPQDWALLALAIMPHSKELEDVNLTAARIVTAAYRELLAKLESIKKP